MRTSSSVIVAAVVVATVAIAGGAVASEPASTDHDNGIGANYTVGLPNETDHYPGTQGGAASIRHYAAADDLFEVTSSPEGLEQMDTLTISNQDILFGSCSTEDTAAFGIDRGNNNSGTKTDDGLLRHRENSAFNEHSIFVDFYGEGSLGGEPVDFNAEDQIVAAQNECYEMPSEPGWYQINARINGTGYDGSYVDTADQDAGIFSHYFYICECSSRSEAESQLGPAPSDDSGGGGSDDGGSSETATATATPEPSGGSDDGGSSTATATATATAEQTATATAEATATATAEPDDGGSEQTATAEATATATAEPDDGGAAEATAEQTATATAGSNGGGGQAQPGGQQSGPGTPTVGAGPGFGLVAALGGLVAVALLAFRRD